MIRRARRGPSPAGPAWRATTAASPRAIPTHRRAARSPYSRGRRLDQPGVSFSTAGSYVISVSAAQRANFGTSDEEVQVEVDGTVVNTFTPAGTNYTTYTTPLVLRDGRQPHGHLRRSDPTTGRPHRLPRSSQHLLFADGARVY